jgi:hypothetical protein
MIRSIRLALAWRRFNAADARFRAYQGMAAGAGWSHAVACALRSDLVRHERALSHLINA